MRTRWRADEQGLYQGERYVFVDECGAQTTITPRYVRAPRGQRAYGRAPHNHRHNITLVAALTHGGVGATMVIEGAMNGPAFVAYLEQQLVPRLPRGQIVVRDNLGVHHAPVVRERVEAAGCRVASLSAYSPDLNPIEHAFSKVKVRVRRAEARTHAWLVDAFGEALDTVTAQDAYGWIKHSGYRLRPRQPL